MERRLIVMRHAKSSWDVPGQSDHQRTLNARGRDEAPRVARRLAELGWRPAFVLSSDAVRTRETLELMAHAWDRPVESVCLGALYLGDYQDLMGSLLVVPDNASPLMVLGHNPGLEGIVARLSGSPITLKTATAVLLVGTGDSWDAALRATGTWDCQSVVRGRELADGV